MGTSFSTDEIYCYIQKTTCMQYFVFNGKKFMEIGQAEEYCLYNKISFNIKQRENLIQSVKYLWHSSGKTV